MKLKSYIAALHAALFAILLAASPAGSGSMLLLGAGKAAGGGGGGCTEATAYFARKSGTTGNSDLQTYICGLVTDGVWAKLDALYVFGQDTQANSLLSLVSATYNATGTPSVPTWATGSGGAGGFSNCCGDYIDSNFNPSTASSPQFTQNSASIFVWANTPPDNNPYAGTLSGGTAYIYPGNGGSSSYAINTGSFACNGTPGGAGFYTVSRTGSTTTDGYRNGSVNTSGCTTASAAVPNVKLVFGKGDGGAGTTGQYIIGGIGSGLTSTDATNLYNRTHTLLQAIAGYP